MTGRPEVGRPFHKQHDLPITCTMSLSRRRLSVRRLPVFAIPVLWQWDIVTDAASRNFGPLRCSQKVSHWARWESLGSEAVLIPEAHLPADEFCPSPTLFLFTRMVPREKHLFISSRPCLWLAWAWLSSGERSLLDSYHFWF